MSSPHRDHGELSESSAEVLESDSGEAPERESEPAVSAVDATLCAADKLPLATNFLGYSPSSLDEDGIKAN